MIDPYVTDEATGDGWTLMLGDSCERLAEIEADSIDLSVCSPPFASLYTYSPSPRDLGNCASREDFLDHYGYVIREQLRVTKPGRIACIHVANLSNTKASYGAVSVHDFRGDVIRAFVGNGWLYNGEVTVDKDPQAAAIRTKSHRLMFATLHRDSAGSAPALADYLLIFRKPGENAVPVKPDVSNEEWIAWARPVWYGIAETNTLNAKVAREDADERHLAPLQLEFIERCVRLWSNRGELVLSPFAGIGSEGYVALHHGRRFHGIELKASYWRTAERNLRAAEIDRDAPLLDALDKAEVSA
jgi:DNA modification methylase